MKKITISLIFLGTFFLLSCKTTINPYYTTVEKMYNVEPGMTLTEITKALGVNPYEIYMDVNNGNRVLVFKYKKRHQKVPMNKQNKEEYLATSNERYLEEGSIYMIFTPKENKLISYYTTSGRYRTLEELIWEDKMKLVYETPSSLKYEKPTEGDQKLLSFGKKSKNKNKNKGRGTVGASATGNVDATGNTGNTGKKGRKGKKDKSN
jgi:hypothetical protein